MKLKKGDSVVVLIGKDKGKKGVIEDVFPRLGKVLVTGINQVKKHKKKRDENTPGAIVTVTVPLNVSKVALADPKTGKPTKIGYVVSKAGKDRIAKKSGQKV